MRSTKKYYFIILIYLIYKTVYLFITFENRIYNSKYFKMDIQKLSVGVHYLETLSTVEYIVYPRTWVDKPKSYKQEDLLAIGILVPTKLLGLPRNIHNFLNIILQSVQESIYWKYTSFAHRCAAAWRLQNICYIFYVARQTAAPSCTTFVYLMLVNMYSKYFFFPATCTWYSRKKQFLWYTTHTVNCTLVLLLCTGLNRYYYGNFK